MNIENATVVFSDADTGKAYARQMTVWEANLVMGQLQALDDGPLKAIEVAPFILRSPGVSEERAQQIVKGGA